MRRPPRWTGLAQIFPKTTNHIPLVLGLGGPVLGLVVVAGIWYYGSPWYTDVGYRPHQPVPYSHKLHVGELGLDCRYCHASVEVSSEANVPPTQVCMNCHTLIKRDSPLLEAIRESARTGRRMRLRQRQHGCCICIRNYKIESAFICVNQRPIDGRRSKESCW